MKKLHIEFDLITTDEGAMTLYIDANTKDIILEALTARFDYGDIENFNIDYI